MREEIVIFLETKYPEETVVILLDEEILNWVDSDWEEEYESEYDWYIDHNNGEAEEVTLSLLCREVESNFILSKEEQVTLEFFLKNKYTILTNHF